MRWRGERESDNVEDRRGMSMPRGFKMGGLGGLGLLAVVIIGMLLGVDPTALLQEVSNMQDPTVSVEQQNGSPAVDDDMRKFVAVVLAETEDVWHGAFRQKGGVPTESPSWYFFQGRFNRRAVSQVRQQAPFIVRVITGSTWI